MACDCDYVLGKHDVTEEHYSNCSSLLNGRESKRNADGTLNLPNKNLSKMDVDFLYHLSIDTANFDLPAMFGDVKFVVMGGTKHRMREFACYIATILGLPQDSKPVNLTKASQRYAMYKVGPVLSVNHGIGNPSMTTVLQEVIKLMYYAKAKDPMFIRLGTSGGLGIPPGSVVISTFGLSGTLEKSFELTVLGVKRTWPSYLDKRLSEELVTAASEFKEFKTYAAASMGANDFYLGQGRLDGPLCDYSEADKMEYLNKLTSLGVRNIEMEVMAFAAITSEAGVRAGIACVTFVDRLKGDQVTIPKAVLNEWQKHPMFIVGAFIKKYVENRNKH
ncbi:unnamed protein product [Chilo suppressalis]|uniref:Nucleoside phosphorylase domain-containing protein n=1 Tax=Chilo suppressalis TaxID=168631 RepID=A0ABN8B9S0_CHISP|nr:unnamed protein product [Chilo suppressalis]